MEPEYEHVDYDEFVEPDHPDNLDPDGAERALDDWFETELERN